MPIARFQMPDGRVARFEVPEGTTPEQAQSMIAANMQDTSPGQDAPPVPAKIGREGFGDALRDVLRGTDWGTRNIAGAGSAVSNLGTGLKQLAEGSELYNLLARGRFAKASDSAGSARDQARIAENKIIEEEAPIGSLAGNIALTAPAFTLTGPSLLAAGAAGSAVGAAQPVGQDNPTGHRALNTAVGGALSAAGQKVANKSGQWIQDKMAALAQKKTANVVIDDTLQRAMAEGYKIPPSMMPDSGLTSRLLEGLSGKYKTNQLAGIHNQNVTDKLARLAVGLPDDVPLTSEAMQQIRSSAYAHGYQPVERFGKIKADSSFIDDLDSIVSNRKMAANAFPGAIKDEITPFVESLKRSQQFDAGDAMKAIQIFRNQANEAYRAGNADLGAAKKAAAKAIEDQIERTLQVKVDAKDAWQAIDDVLGRRMSDADLGVMKKARAIVGNLKTGKTNKDDALEQLVILAPKSKTANDALMVAHDLVRNASDEAEFAKQLLGNFRDARVLMAKAHTVEDAIIEGGGKVNAMKLASRLQAGKPLSGDLKTIAQFANNFKDVARVPKSGDANPLTAMDYMFATPAGMLGVLAAGGPVGASAAMIEPAARISARYGLLSGPVQRAIAQPSYQLGTLPRVTGGLLQYSPVGATAFGLDALNQ